MWSWPRPDFTKEEQALANALAALPYDRAQDVQTLAWFQRQGRGWPEPGPPPPLH